MNKYRIMAGYPHPETGKPWGIGSSVQAESAQAAVDKYRADEEKAAREHSFFSYRKPAPVFAVYLLTPCTDWS